MMKTIESTTRATMTTTLAASLAACLLALLAVATTPDVSLAQDPPAKPSPQETSSEKTSSETTPQLPREAEPSEDADNAPAPQPGGDPVPPGIAPTPMPQQSDQQKAEEILQRIGETLREVEQLMVEMSFEAESTGAGQTKVVEEIDKLLDEAGRQQQAVLDGIDELIEMARQQQQQQSQQGGSSSQQRQDQQQQQQEQQQQQNPSQQDQAGQPENQEEKNGNQPEDAQNGKGDPKNPRRPGDPAPEEHWSQDVNGRWGALPPKLQELIRQGDPAKFPPQYREMLEEYYKRLSDQDK